MHLHVRALFMNETDIRSFPTHIRLLDRESRLSAGISSKVEPTFRSLPLFPPGRIFYANSMLLLRKNRFLSTSSPSKRNLIKFWKTSSLSAIPRLINLSTAQNARAINAQWLKNHVSTVNWSKWLCRFSPMCKNIAKRLSSNVQCVK